MSSISSYYIRSLRSLLCTRRGKKVKNLTKPTYNYSSFPLPVAVNPIWEASIQFRLFCTNNCSSTNTTSWDQIPVMPKQVWSTYFKQLSIIFFLCVCSTELSRQWCFKWKFKNLNFEASLLSLWKLQNQTIVFQEDLPKQKEVIQTRKLFDSSLPCTNFRSH